MKTEQIKESGRMMPGIRMQELMPGEPVEVLFRGSRRLGNTPYRLRCRFEGLYHGEAGELTARFDWGHAYRMGPGEWRYGASAERLSIVRRILPD